MAVCLPLRSSASSALKASAGAFNAEGAEDRRGNQALHQQKEHVLGSTGRCAERCFCVDPRLFRSAEIRDHAVELLYRGSTRKRRGSSRKTACSEMSLSPRTAASPAITKS